MIPAGLARGGEQELAVVDAEQALLEDQDGIAVWQGIGAETEVFLARAVAQPGTQIPPHVHSVDTVAHVVAGRAVFRFGEQLQHVRSVGPGDWVFVPSGVLHTEETPADSSVDFVYARDRSGGTTTYREPASSDAKTRP